MLEHALLGIKAALIEASLQDCRPMGHNSEQLVAGIEGSKRNVAMYAWLPQASGPCGNFSDPIKNIP
jgi:hypothetical protein